MTEPSAPEDPVALQSEIEQLRERNAELESHGQSPPRGGGWRHVLRSIGSAVLIVVGVLCLVAAPLAIWGRNLVLNTDRYVQTVEPLASDPGVQNSVIRIIDDQVESHVDVSSIVAQVLPPRAQVLAGPLQNAVNGLVNEVATRFVRSDRFQKLWVTVNRAAHDQITSALTGKVPDNPALRVLNNGKVVLNLAPIVDQVKTRLVDAGLTVAQAVPPVGATLEIADVKGLQKAQRATRALNAAANWLPWVGLVLTAAGVALAHRRRRAVVASALALAVGMVVIGVGLLVGRSIYLDGVPTATLPRSTASLIFDTLVRYLRLGIRLILLVGLLIAFGAWVSGPSRPATALRRGVVRGPRALGARLDTGPIGPFVVRYAAALRVGVVGLMFLILLLMDAPSLGTVIVLAVIALILLLIVEMLRATAEHGRTA